LTGNGLAGEGNRWIVRWLPVAGYVGIILAVSSIPMLQVPGGLQGTDKLAHLIEYGILGTLVRRAVGVPGWRGLLITIATGVAIGAIDETYQASVPGRERSLLDLGADFLGSVIGASVQPLIAKRRKPRG
jgi:VanZ family protein